VIAPLTTAISTREYQVSGAFTGSLKGPGGGPAKGVLEVGYQIRCGIEMTTGNGVIVNGNAGGAAGLGVGFGPLGNDLEVPQDWREHRRRRGCQPQARPGQHHSGRQEDLRRHGTTKMV
jgi:hypothetical protein